MIFGPPAAPTVIIGFPSLSSTIVGLMLDNGRLPGAMLLFSAPTRPNVLGTSGRIEKESISSLRTTPGPGAITFEPGRLECGDRQMRFVKRNGGGEN